MLQYDEHVNAQVASAILGEDYNPSYEYFMYTTLTEVSLRAVDPRTGEEVWRESRKVDTPDAIVQVRRKTEPKYYGHWFSQDYTLRRRTWPIAAAILITCFAAGLFVFSWIK